MEVIFKLCTLNQNKEGYLPDDMCHLAQQAVQTCEIFIYPLSNMYIIQFFLYLPKYLFT
jgi:hypothetical protein